MMQCSATSKRTGERCQRAAMKGKSVCYNHGGKSLGGLAAPALKHGRYSSYLPENLRGRYMAAMDDPELTELRADLALVETRLTELIEQVNVTGSHNSIEAIKTLSDQLREAARRNAPKDIQNQLVNDLIRQIDLVAKHGRTWNDIMRLLDQRRRIIETESRRQKELSLTISIPQIELFISAFLEIVKEHVNDRKALSAINTEVVTLLHDRKAS